MTFGSLICFYLRYKEQRSQKTKGKKGGLNKDTSSVSVSGLKPSSLFGEITADEYEKIKKTRKDGKDVPGKSPSLDSIKTIESK